MILNKPILIRNPNDFLKALFDTKMFQIDLIEEGKYKGEAIIKIKDTFLRNFFNKNWIAQLLKDNYNNFYIEDLHTELFYNSEELIKFMDILKKYSMKGGLKKC